MMVRQVNMIEWGTPWKILELKVSRLRYDSGSFEMQDLEPIHTGYPKMSLPVRLLYTYLASISIHRPSNAMFESGRRPNYNNKRFEFRPGNG